MLTFVRLNTSQSWILWLHDSWNLSPFFIFETRTVPVAVVYWTFRNRNDVRHSFLIVLTNCDQEVLLGEGPTDLSIPQDEIEGWSVKMS